MDSIPDDGEYGSRAKRLKLDVESPYALVDGAMELRRPISDQIDVNYDSAEGNFLENMLILVSSEIINMADLHTRTRRTCL